MGRYGPFQIQAVFLRLRIKYVLAIEVEVGGRPISKLPINEAKLVSTKITLVAEPWLHDISGRYVIICVIRMYVRRSVYAHGTEVVVSFYCTHT